MHILRQKLRTVLCSRDWFSLFYQDQGLCPPFPAVDFRFLGSDDGSVQLRIRRGSGTNLWNNCPQPTLPTRRAYACLAPLQHTCTTLHQLQRIRTAHVPQNNLLRFDWCRLQVVCGRFVWQSLSAEASRHCLWRHFDQRQESFFLLLGSRQQLLSAALRLSAPLPATAHRATGALPVTKQPTQISQF